VSDPQLTEAFFAKAAGWEVMKEARALLAAGRVLSSNWTPPMLKGVVQSDQTSLRAGLVIRGALDIENVCPCRKSREWGTICAHSVAVGLHHLKGHGRAGPGIRGSQPALRDVFLPRRIAPPHGLHQGPGATAPLRDRAAA